MTLAVDGVEWTTALDDQDWRISWHPPPQPPATLHREVWEEACATVTGQRLLGYSRGACIRGHEQGRILVGCGPNIGQEARP